MDTCPAFTSPLASVLTQYLALKTALGRGYATERHLFRSFDAFLVAVGAADLTSAVFDRWCQTQVHLKSGIRRTQMRMVRNLCLYRRRTEPECFVPDPAFFPPCHQYTPPYLLTEDQMARLIATATTLFTTSAYPLRAQAIRVGLVLLYTAGLRRGELVRLTVGDYDRQAHSCWCGRPSSTNPVCSRCRWMRRTHWRRISRRDGRIVWKPPRTTPR